MCNLDKSPHLLLRPVIIYHVYLLILYNIYIHSNTYSSTFLLFFPLPSFLLIFVWSTSSRELHNVYGFFFKKRINSFSLPFFLFHLFVYLLFAYSCVIAFAFSRIFTWVMSIVWSERDFLFAFTLKLVVEYSQKKREISMDLVFLECILVCLPS